MTIFTTAKRSKGFTMFFAVLVSSLALAIGLAIYDLVTRELQLSSTTAQSQYAIYAADTGIECALYWDFKYNSNKSIFPTSSADTMARNATGALCNGQDITVGRQMTMTANSAMTTTTIQLQPFYAVVAVIKTVTGTSQTVLTPTSGGSITDSSGNVWTLRVDTCVYKNNVQVAGGCNTSQLTYVSSTATIWGQDATSFNWYWWDGTTWQGPGSNPLSGAAGIVQTSIYSHGYNTLASTSPNAVERELQVRY
jgi:hypothetical protein